LANYEDRKGSQGFVVMYIRGSIAWRSNKQDTVTTSSTEAQFLALSQTAREALFIERLFKDIGLDLYENITIEANNT
jgi:hypothetical protein